MDRIEQKSRLMQLLINQWHSWMNMPIEDPDWYQAKLDGELIELSLAPNQIMKLSEQSDVLYSYSRALFDGHDLALDNHQIYYRWRIAFYMIAKLTSRRVFYIKVGKKMHPSKDMKALRNPKKDENLRSLAQKHNYNEVVFMDVATKLRKKWLFLP